MTTFYFDLTSSEKEEFNQLRGKLIGDEPFTVFTDEVIQTEEFKRYDYLLNKKMNYLKQIQKQK